jgi:regulator of cell morphogenesis and NO signaling
MATAETTVREIALDKPVSIRVFERLGSDYCCGGRKPLAQACAERSLDLRSVLAALENTETSKDASTDWTTASLESLCQHIVTTHHEYVRREIPRLGQFATKVVARGAANTGAIDYYSGLKIG